MISKGQHSYYNIMIYYFAIMIIQSLHTLICDPTSDFVRSRVHCSLQPLLYLPACPGSGMLWSRRQPRGSTQGFHLNHFLVFIILFCVAWPYILVSTLVSSRENFIVFQLRSVHHLGLARFPHLHGALHDSNG